MAAQENLPLCATVREDNLQDTFSRHCQEICNEWTFRNNHLSVFHAHTSWNVIIMIETRIPNLCYRSILIYLCYTCRCWYVLHLNIHFISCSLPSILVRTYALSLKCVQTHAWQELKSDKKGTKILLNMDNIILLPLNRFCPFSCVCSHFPVNMFIRDGKPRDTTLSQYKFIGFLKFCDTLSKW